MENIEKALRDLAKAVESNETVKRVTVTITMQKPKPSKAPKKANKLSRQGRGESPSRKSYYTL